MEDTTFQASGRNRAAYLPQLCRQPPILLEYHDPVYRRFGPQAAELAVDGRVGKEGVDSPPAPCDWLGVPGAIEVKVVRPIVR